MSINLQYPDIVNLIGGDGMTVKQQSRQLLVWFLLNYYRLEEIDAFDSVCDESDDKGIDGIYVNDNIGEIHVLSSKLRTTSNSTLGDKDLKNLKGSMDKLRTGDGVRQLINTTSNNELKAILIDKKIATKVEDGYEIRGILVSNGASDDNTTNYLNLFPASNFMTNSV